MSFFDIVVPFIIGCSSILGFTRGFVNEFMRLAVWIFSVFSTYLGLAYYPPVFKGIIHDDQISFVLSGLALFVFFFLLFKVFHYFVSSAVKTTKLRGIDKALGFGFGLVRGVFIASFLFILAGIALPPKLQANVSSDLLHFVSGLYLDAFPQKYKDMTYGFLQKHHPKFSQAAPSKEEMLKKFSTIRPDPEKRIEIRKKKNAVMLENVEEKS